LRQIHRAVELLEKAARRGYWLAQFSYAECLEQGVGCKRDLLEASHYFELAFVEGVTGAEAGFVLYLKARR
jgi:TPR repeat protein